MYRRRLTHYFLYLALIFSLFTTTALKAQDTRQTDSLALVALYNATNGANWTNKWILAQPMTAWYGVTLTNGRVTCLDLDGVTSCTISYLNGNNLQGTIPTALTNLQEIKSIFLGNNKLTGSIPALNLPKLENLYLYGNQLSGDLPTFVLPNLVNISLGNNQLTGIISNLNFPLLKTLNLYQNKFSGSIPNFNMPELIHVNLATNELSGTIPNFSYPNLTFLNFSANQLSGSIPNFNLPTLDTLNLSTNQLSGSIPNFSNLPNLAYLALNDNQLSGNMPNFSNLTKLVSLYLFSNQLSGNVPNFTLPNVQILSLSRNQLSGNIPNFTLPTLQLLNLGFNQLSGTIPNFSLPNLQNLSIASNQMSGSIPTFNLPNLQQLFLNNNQLTGTIPNLNMPKMTSFRLRNNKLSGTIPNLVNDILLKEFLIDTNALTFDGLIQHTSKAYTTFTYSPQDSIYKDTTIKVTIGNTATIDLAIDGAITTSNYKWFKNGIFLKDTNRNKLILRGVQPNDAGVYTCQVTNSNAPLLTLYSQDITIAVDTPCWYRDSLALVDLYNATGGANWTNKWDLTKPIKTWYGIQVDANGCVTCIDLDGNASCAASGSGNNLVGILPVSLDSLKELTSIFLSDNRLSGTIPNLSLPKLAQIWISNNQLSGSIPNFNLPNLKFLSLNGNQLIGNIPDFNLPNLISLTLDDNQLTGNIPNFNLPNLQRLWLDRNQLSGSIPNFNLPKLKHLILSYNQLTGKVPNFIMPQLNQFSFRNNQINEIPDFTYITTWNKLVVVIFPTNYLGSVFRADSNKLSFSSIIPNLPIINSWKDDSRYSPQDSIYKETTLQNTEGSSLTIDLGIDGAITDNNYKWFKNGVSYQTTAVNKLPFTNLKLTDAGVYTCQVTNPRAPLLTLYSRKITIIVNPSLIDTTTCRYKDSLQLINLYNATNGANWTNKWDLTKPITAWYGVTTNSSGCVTGVYLQANGLTGVLPNLDMSNIQLFALKNGQLSGTIPNFNFPNLTQLELTFNQLSGAIPNFNMPKLAVLELGFNQLSGTILNLNFPNLISLNLTSNKLTGTIPNFNMPELLNLWLGGNQLTGTIPNFSLPKLENTELSYNQLTGSIPTFNMPNLKNMAFNNNQLSGTIPNFNMPKLEKMFLYNNQLNGSIPSFSMPNLQLLWLNNNQLSGGIPNFAFSNLESLKLNDNQLSGSIPSFNMPKLNWLYLHKNQLAGTIPNFNLPSMQTMRLDSNLLSGIFPPFSSLTKLNILQFHDNDIDSVPNLSFLPLKSDSATLIRGLRNQGNKLTFDDILPNIGFTTTATYIYTPQDSIYKDTTLKNTEGSSLTIDLGIDGAITDNSYKWFKNGVSYQTNAVNKLSFTTLKLTDAGVYTCQVTNPRAPLLTLNSRKITIVVNAALVDTTACRYKDSVQLVNLYNATNGNNWKRKDNWLSNKPLNQWYGILTNTEGCVTHIDLDGIPDFTPNIETASGGNGLSGQLLDLSFSELLVLDLDDNALSGTLPVFNMPKIETITIGNNQLTGTIPSTWTVTNLQNLALCCNRFDGSIASIPFPNLKGLYLQDNKFRGTLPTISSTNIAYIQMSNNLFSGCFPTSYKGFCAIPNPLNKDFSRNPNLPNNGDFTAFCNSTSLPTTSQNRSVCEGQSYTLPSGTVVTTANTYRETLKYLNGCDSAVVVTNLTINPLPTPSISGTTSICTGKSTNLTASAGFPTYKWSTNATSQSINVNTANTFTVSVTDANGCTGTASATVSIKPNATATLNITISQGKTYTVPSGKRIYTTSGTYLDTIAAFNGCDSLLTINLMVNTIVVNACRQDDSLALITLYNATGGPNWTNKWDLSTPINTWYGVILNTSECVVSIRLNKNNLIGSLPNLTFQSLKIFSLDSNKLNGSIPNLNMPNLINFSLNSNQLSGKIPNFNLPNLQQLDFTVNQLSGDIPNFDLPNLVSLSLRNNQLTGNVPNFNLPKLETLDLFANKLSGSIPNFNTLPNLKNLYLSINKLDGTIPNFNNLPNLLVISLDNNQLTGSIPDFNLPKLQTLRLSNNKINGNIPISLSLLSNLIRIEIIANLLDGTVPTELGNLTKLQGLALSTNKLTGAIPSSFRNLINLESLFLLQNQFTYIPDLSNLPLLPDSQGGGFKGLNIQQNKITFESILPNIKFSTTASYRYEPQDSIFKDTTITLPTGCDLTVDLKIDGAITDNKYKWFKSGTVKDSSNINKLILRGVKPSDAGVYTVEVTNPNAPLLTLKSRKITVVVNSLTPTTQNKSICAGQSYTLPSGKTVTTANTYRDTLKSLNGCDSVLIVTNLTINTFLQTAVNKTICQGQTYVLPKNGTVSTSGIYKDTLKSVAGCDSIVTTNLTVSALPKPSISGTTTICLGKTTTLTASAGFSNYKWSNNGTTQGISVNTANTFMVTVTDANGCSGTAATTVSLVPNPTRTLDTAINQGQTYTVPSGKKSYTTSGTYMDTLAFSTTCDSILTIKLTVFSNQRISTTATSQNVICTGGTQGIINLTPAGGNGNFTYKWSNNATTQNISNLAAGVYRVTITSGTSTQVDSFTITQPNAIQLAASSITNSRCGKANGAVSIPNPTGGNGGFIFNWTGGSGFTATTQNISNLSAGQYTVAVRDSKGCTAPLQTVTVGNNNEAIVIPLNKKLCETDSLKLLDKRVIKKEGTYNDTLRHAGSCDSIIVWTVSIDPNCKDSLLSKIKIYNTFTPTGDGKNEFFYIENIDLIPSNVLHIFSRNGELIRTIEGYDNTKEKKRWNGTGVNESNLPEGVYYYVLYPSKGSKKHLKGSIFLIR